MSETQAVQYFDTERPMPLTKLPVRSAVIALTNARLFWSPGSRLTEADHRAAGDVTHLIVPNLHHLSAGVDAARRHPKAELWGPRGATEKHPELSWKIFGEDAWPFESELAHFTLDGMPAFNESVFLLRSTGQLFVGDLFFNIQNPQGFGSWLIFSAFGTYGHFGLSRLFLMFVKDRPAFLASLRKVAALPFQEIIPAHGAIVRTEAKAHFDAALKERKVSL